MMKNIFCASIIAVLISGCSSDTVIIVHKKDPPTITDNCGIPHTGKMLAHYAESYGNSCGSIPDVIIDRSSQLNLSCDPGSYILDTINSSGTCDVETNVKNCINGTNSTISVDGIGHYNEDFSEETATMFVTITSGNQTCSGVYYLTLTEI